MVIDVDGEIETDAGANNETSLVAELTQPLASVTVTVYVVDAVGDAVTVALLVVFNPVAGDQLYVTPPFAESTTLPPPQISAAVDGDIAMAGSGFTVTSFVAEPTQPLASVPVTV
jgi:hypothetical protein